MPRAKRADPENLRPFLSHGVELTWTEKEARGECFLCGSDKFFVEVETSLWQCKVCMSGNRKGGGNAHTFIQKLHEASLRASLPDETEELRADRGLLSADYLTQWGVCKSVTNGEWLAPAYNANGAMNQLYRYTTPSRTSDKRTLVATAGLGIGVFGLPQMNPDCREVFICEGPWDGLALKEAIDLAEESDATTVISVPGAGTFQESWCPLFAGKDVVLAFDNDHPRLIERTGTIVQPGLDGVKRTANLLLACDTPPSSIRYVCWGYAGCDLGKKDGWDLRDELTQSDDPVHRIAAYRQLREMVLLVPDEGFTALPGSSSSSSGKKGKLSPVPCSSWDDLLQAMRSAIRSRQEIEDVLATMLAVCASTSQSGNQLFLMVLGDPGSSKSTLCDSLLVSNNCHQLEDITNFYSGYKLPSGEDCSLIDRINHKTLITSEGNVIMSSAKFDVIMSQMRRIFDGTGGKGFGNTTEDNIRTGLRTPWILAGTLAMLGKNQSELGDRFIKIVIHAPTDEEKGRILNSVAYSALRAVRQRSNGDAATTVEAAMKEFMQLCGGYVDWLRKNMEQAVNDLTIDESWVSDECAMLGEFCACMRARPSTTHKDATESHDTKELPSRLTHQFVRLACCLAVALNRPGIDDEVMRILRKVAVDTAIGSTLNIAKYLYDVDESDPDNRKGGRYGRYRTDVQQAVHLTETNAMNLLSYLRKIGVAEPFRYEGSNQTRWRLTTKFSTLFKKVMD